MSTTTNTSTQNLKPLTLHGKGGANPPKVAILLNLLQIPYTYSSTSFANVKSPEYLAVNPNGRMPALQDPNTGLTLWESGAILEYLVEKYDTEKKYSFAPGSDEYYLAKQWLMFQMSGQGPYYGQAVHFHKYHPEQLQSAKERYVKEIARVTGVLEAHLKKQKEQFPGTDGPWMVGNKMSYVDVAFLPWQVVVGEILLMNTALFDQKEFPEVKGWMERMERVEGVDEVLDEHMRVPLKGTAPKEA
jgi:glutathione S-transferase